MKKLILLMLLSLLLCRTALSQDTDVSRLRETNRFLLEGLECKDLLNNTRKMLLVADSISTKQKLIISYKDSQIHLLKQALDTSKKETIYYKKKLADTENKLKKVEITGHIFKVSTLILFITTSILYLQR